MNAHTEPRFFELETFKDAQRFSDALNEQERRGRQASYDETAYRPACEAIKAISDLDFSPAVAAQICTVLSSRIARSNWSHLDCAESAQDSLNDAHDFLNEVTHA